MIMDKNKTYTIGDVEEKMFICLISMARGEMRSFFDLFMASFSTLFGMLMENVELGKPMSEEQKLNAEKLTKMFISDFDEYISINKGNEA